MMWALGDELEINAKSRYRLDVYDNKDPAATANLVTAGDAPAIR
ncbi:MAG: hypothetical protein ACM359_06520 [Bacillota bacterium]